MPPSENTVGESAAVLRISGNGINRVTTVPVPILRNGRFSIDFPSADLPAGTYAYEVVLPDGFSMRGDYIIVEDKSAPTSQPTP